MTDSLEERLQNIERRIEALEGGRRMSPPPLPEDLLEIPSASSSNITSESEASTLPLWLRENWLACIGVFLIILALSWFVHYAFTNNWIKESLRIYLGSIAGMTIYLLGFHLLKKKPNGSQILMILGQSITIITLIFGYYFYHLFSVFHCFIFLLMAISLTSLIAIVKNLEGLGFSSIFFAALSPLVLYIDFSCSIFLLSYIAAIDLMALWMLFTSRWGKTFHLVWVITLIYSCDFMKMENPLSVLLFIWVFYLIFFLPLASYIYKRKLFSLPLKGLFIGSTLPYIFAFWIIRFVKFPWNVVSNFSASLLWIILGYFVANKSHYPSNSDAEKYFSGIMIAICAIAFLFLGTYDLIYNLLPSSHSQEVTILLYFTEIALAIVIGRFIFQSSLLTIYLSLFFIIPLSCSLPHYYQMLYTPSLDLKFFLVCTALMSLLVAAYLNFPAQRSSNFYPRHSLIINSLWVIAGIFSMLLIWNIYHQIFSISNIARGCTLTTYVLIGEAMIYLGHRKNWQQLRTGGLAGIIWVILCLLGNEIWEMSTIIRIITFVVIGLLLVGTAFFDKKCENAT